MTRRLLILGRSGQVARELLSSAQADGLEAIAVGRETLDLSREDGISLLDRLRPDAVINAAAYTAVDRAEQEEALAFALNADLPGRFARACGRRDLPFVHLSTDCVFDGEKGAPYVEDDARRPINAYGRTKAAGEAAVEAEGGRWAVLRTSWVFSAGDGNFVSTMLSLARARDTVDVVADQVGRPTPAGDLARAARAVAEALLAGNGAAVGIFHAAGDADASRAELAHAVFLESARLGGPVARVLPVFTADRPTPARRPLNARLGGTRLEAAIGWRSPDWRAALAPCVSAWLSRHAAQPLDVAAPPQLASARASL